MNGFITTQGLVLYKAEELMVTTFPGRCCNSGANWPGVRGAGCPPLPRLLHQATVSTVHDPPCLAAPFTVGRVVAR